ncbi:MAG: hypothetical protein IJU16_08100 [Clostridia bacterium]|nr:hypothetical protein [Clostridia bacterium]
MKRVAILLIALVCLLCLCACNGGGTTTPVTPDSSDTTDTAAATTTTRITTLNDPYITVETPYCTLAFPQSFEGNVEHTVTSEDPYTLKFTANDGAELFSILFGQETPNLLGTLVLEDRCVVMYADFAPLNSGDARYFEYGEYQNGITTMMEHLVAEYEFVVNEAVTYEERATFTLDDSVAPLQYPLKWKDQVQVEKKDDTVIVSASGQNLFGVCYVDCDGYLLGSYKGTPVYMLSYTIDKTAYTAEVYDTLQEMQNDVNVLISCLTEDPDFSME